jgi:predicted RNA binding protein YcfA (HicA-like mRNA interferase family)
MSQWSSAKAKRVLAALLRIGWTIKRESSSHKTLSRSGWSDVVFAFHDKDEIVQKCSPVSANTPALNQRIYRQIFCFRWLSLTPSLRAAEQQNDPRNDTKRHENRNSFVLFRVISRIVGAVLITTTRLLSRSGHDRDRD